MTLICRVVNANNQKCNLLGSLIGVFLHACNTPDRVIDVLWRMNTSISVSSIINSINSLSEESAKHIKAAGRTLLYSFVLDNFDVQLKHKASTVEQSKETMFHLISGSLVKLAHASRDSLKYLSYLWERSRFNDQRTIALPRPSIHALINLHPNRLDSHGLNRKERFTAWKFMSDLCMHGPKYFRQFLSRLSGPEDIEKIPIVKTHQVPAKSMRFNNSTIDGNIDAIENLLNQGGVEGLEDYVVIFHGDVGTGERFRSAQMYRSIERTERDRLQFVIFVPGMFHTEMTCADALYRMFLESTAGHSDESSLYGCIALLYPNNTTNRIANNKASFQTLSDCITHVGTSDRLECWRAYIQSMFPDMDTLDSWASLNPSFEDVYAIARVLASTYNLTSVKAEKLRKKPLEERDQQYENSLARIDYFLLYEETVHSMRHGDIGRLETCLYKWIPVFKGTGKHKYANMLSEFMLDVHFVYPADLRKVVRYNWLCNPGGTIDGFRGVDWLLELNNLLTKVIYGGRSSNYTIDRIIKESPLIQLYRDSKRVIEEQFLLTPKSMRHGKPDMTATYAALSGHAIDTNFLTFKPGRTSKYPVPDVFTIGMERYEAELAGLVSSGETDDTVDTGCPSYEVTATEEEIYNV